MLLGLFLIQGTSIEAQAAVPDPILYLDFERDLNDNSSSHAQVVGINGEFTNAGYDPLGDYALKLDGAGAYLTVAASDGSALLAGKDNLTISVFADVEIKGGNSGFRIGASCHF